MVWWSDVLKRVGRATTDFLSSGLLCCVLGQGTWLLQTKYLGLSCNVPSIFFKKEWQFNPLGLNWNTVEPSVVTCSPRWLSKSNHYIRSLYLKPLLTDHLSQATATTFSAYKFKCSFVFHPSYATTWQIISGNWITTCLSCLRCDFPHRYDIKNWTKIAHTLHSISV